MATILAAVLSALAIGGGAVAINRLSDDRVRLADQLDPAAVQTLRLSNALINQETGVRGFALAGQEDFLQPYTQGRADEIDAVAQLRRLLGPDQPQAMADLQNVVDAATTWRLQYAEPTIDGVRASRKPTAATTDRGKQLFDVIRTRIAMETTHLDSLRSQARQSLDRSADILLWIACGIAALLVASIIAMAIGLRRGVSQPVVNIAAQVRQVAQGDFQHVIQPAGPVEIVDLGLDVDLMRQRILAEVSSLREAHAALDEQAHDLQRSNDELEQFAYIASHDLQEPLRKVASFCQLLEERYDDVLDDRGRQFIGFAVDGAARMQALINDLLAFSRVGRSGRPGIVLEGNELVDAARANLAAVIEETNATIRVDPLPRLRGDRSLLVAVFQNLIGNAMKFRAPDRAPQVGVSIAAQDGMWLFTVADNGIGIENEYAEKIFVIFQRLHTRDRYPGTGIGLAMCRKIIEYHGGRIWLDTDERDSAGTTFHFTLPRMIETSADPRPAGDATVRSARP